MIIILTIIALAVFAYEIAKSDLAYAIKKVLWMDYEHPEIILISSPKMYLKLFSKKVFIILTPIIIPLILIALLHRYLTSLLSCQYCSAVWVGMVYGGLTGHSLINSFAIGLIISFAVAIYSTIKQ